MAKILKNSFKCKHCNEVFMIPNYSKEVCSKCRAKQVKESVLARNPTRTPRQNRSLHLFFRLLATELNNAGLDMKTVLKPSVDIMWSEQNIKEYIWRPIQDALLVKKSTRLLETKEIDMVHQLIIRHLGEKFGVEVPAIPSIEQTESYLKSLEK